MVKMKIVHSFVTIAPEMAWAINMVEAVLADEPAFLAVFQPLLNVFPKGESIEGSEFYKACESMRNICIDLVPRYSNPNTRIMECFPNGYPCNESGYIIHVSVHFLTSQGARNMSEEPKLNMRLMSFVGLLHQICHIYVPTINVLLGKAASDGPEHIGRVFTRGELSADAGISLQRLLFGGDYLGSISAKFNSLALFRVVDGDLEPKGANVEIRTLPQNNVQAVLRALDDWYQSKTVAPSCWSFRRVRAPVSFPIRVIKDNINPSQTYPIDPKDGACENVAQLSVAWNAEFFLRKPFSFQS